LAKITSDNVILVAPGQESEIRKLEGEEVYIMGPTRGVEAVETHKKEHFQHLHLNPTWDGDWPGWLEDPRDGIDDT
jgi:hypothetical protein